MASTSIVSVLGLLFGDCGKGLFTDYLCRRRQAHTVVRFNGGAQAAHNVVLPDGRQHTFSQFGAGTFVPGTYTLLAYPVIVHPTALLIESEYLRRAGVPDALDRLLIDGRCHVTSPYHQAAGRMRELTRGGAAHGSCGVGVGETVRHGLAQPSQVLRYADLANTGVALAKLEAIRQDLRGQFERGCIGSGLLDAYHAEFAVLDDPSVSGRWLAEASRLAERVPPAPRELVAERLHRRGTVVFEGAQGLLLDEWRGFHPHTTWSSTGTETVEAVLADAGQRTAVHHFGVLRTYLTRHGNGPLPTYDARLDRLEELHNATDTWQGAFRRGHPDAILLRYALSVAGKLDGLFVSHLDVFERENELRWCNAYGIGDRDAEADIVTRDQSGLVTGLLPALGHDLAHQSRLTQVLRSAKPRYAKDAIPSDAAFIGELERVANVPVSLGAFGKTHLHVTELDLRLA